MNKWMKGLFLGIALLTSVPAQNTMAAGTYIMDGADPSIIKESGMYYSVQSDNNGIHLRRSDTLTGLNSFSTQTTVWWKPADLQQIWAPDLVKINNEYWIFFAASPGQPAESFDALNARHRTYALKSSSPGGPYTYMGKVQLPDDKWSIDATVVSYDYKHYIVWSGWAGDTNGEQNIYIAQVDVNNPMAMLSGRKIVSQPREAWELKDPNPPARINEGPQPIVKDGRLLIAFTANGSWGSNYCLGYVRLKAGGDPLNVTHYAKSDACKFQSSSSILGPGHHSWILQGLYDIGLMAYHGVPASQAGTGDWWQARDILYKSFSWTNANMWHSWENRNDYGPVPVLGEP
ncbi:glycoside hydrolase family 43 protein [Paenibacillus caseinilyticus]|uniref:glycoside hydrolase family 43 protein n=1 Tax=Paenibacillus caseinilyticus TaxID=3098138 RepID=UPI0022B8833C|nr:glycoside hydrolase family 43 protein [Paenibacillus caseinilyticus]MCZ8520761.1 glycoside hydrolase family 43 protein [Paenibacillus caseinilyticus]